MRNSILLLLFLVAMLACTTNKGNIKVDDKCKAHPELAKSYISPSPDHVGYLVHRNKCKDVKLYKLDIDFQVMAYQLNFTCMVGGKLYSFCSNKLGLCRNEIYNKKRKGLSRVFKGKYKRVVKNKYIPWADYNFLVSAGTLCKSGI